MELDDREFCVPALHLSACLVLGATRCFRKVVMPVSVFTVNKELSSNSQVPRATHGASGETRNFQSLARPRRRARRSPVPPLDQLRVPPAHVTRSSHLNVHASPVASSYQGGCISISDTNVHFYKTLPRGPHTQPRPPPARMHHSYR